MKIQKKKLCMSFSNPYLTLILLLLFFSQTSPSFKRNAVTTLLLSTVSRNEIDRIFSKEGKKIYFIIFLFIFASRFCGQGLCFLEFELGSSQREMRGNCYGYTRENDIANWFLKMIWFLL